MEKPMRQPDVGQEGDDGNEQGHAQDEATCGLADEARRPFPSPGSFALKS